MLARSFAALALVVTGVAACSPAEIPVGSSCEYRSYAGRCQFANVRNEKNPDDDERSWLTVTYRGQRDDAFELADTFALYTREVPYAERYYRKFDDTACKGQRITKGTCSPQTGGVALPRFHFPGSPVEKGGCEQPLACESECKDQILASCERGAYGAFFGVDTVPDRPRAMYLYRSSLKLAVKGCNEGDKNACQTAATILEIELVGDLPAREKNEALASLYDKACSLGERWSCGATARVQSP